MAETKHTPGPWKLIWHGNERYPYPLSVHTDNDEMWIARDGYIAQPADARLIAAAPELLEALEGVLGAIKFSGWSIDDERWYAPLRNARAAIKKATGD